MAPIGGASARPGVWAWVLVPLTAAAIHLVALLAAPWLAAGMAACGWPQAPNPMPAWALVLAMLAAAALAARPPADTSGQSLARTIVPQALVVGLLLTADVGLASMRLVVYGGLVLIMEALRRLWQRASRSAPAPNASQPVPAGERAPYAAWFLSAFICLVIAGFNYVLSRELQAERAANWAYGYLALGVGAGLLFEFVGLSRLPRGLRRNVTWLSPLGFGACVVAAGVILELSDIPPREVRPAYARTVNYLDQNLRPGDVVVSRGLPRGLRCYGLEHTPLLEIESGQDVEERIATLDGERRVFFVFPTYNVQNRRAERLMLEQRGDLLEQVPDALAVEVYAVRPWLRLAAATPLDADYGPITALSVAVQPEVVSGAAIGVSLHLKLNAPTEEDYLARLVLLDEAGQTVASSDDFLLDGASRHTAEWNTLEPVDDHLLLAVPTGTPPGSYRLALGFLGLDHLTGFSLVDAVGLEQNRLLPVGEIVVNRPADPEADPYGTVDALELSTTTVSAPGVRLLGYRRVSGQVLPGDSLPLLFRWQAEPNGARPRALQLRLLAGTSVLVQQELLMGGRYPTEAWQAGEQVLDRQRWQTPPDLPPGAARAQVSLDNVEWADLGTLNVMPVERTFVEPRPSVATRALFGQVAALVGYDAVVANEQDGTLAVTLYWQAVNDQPLSQRYTVFVHALGPDGQLLAQSDAEPAGAARPTTSWVAGEFIADTHNVTLPADYAGPVVWRIGLYDAETQTRVPSDGSDFVMLDNGLIVPGS